MKPTTEDVLKWAAESALQEELWLTPDKDLHIAVKFAALAYAAGAAAERERCIANCDSVDVIGADECIAAITERARGEKNE